MNPSVIQKYQQLFLSTARQYLQVFGTDLQHYKKTGHNDAVLDQMYICMHSIKSQSSVMRYDQLVSIAQNGEQLLRSVKESKQHLSNEQLTQLEQLSHQITDELQLIEKTGTDVVSLISQQPNVTQMNGKHILLIEDDNFFEQFYAFKLQETGFTVYTAQNGQIGLQLLQEKKPDIVLLDLIMPVKDGFQVLEERNKIESIKHIPIIVFSTLGQETDVQRAKSLGAIDYINKSFFDFEKLLAKITQYL